MSKTFEQLKDMAKSFAVSFGNTQKLTKICVFILVSAAVVVYSVFTAGATFAYNVSLNGEVIATVKSKQVVASALDIVDSRVNGNGAKSAVGKPEYSLVLTTGEKLDGDKTVANKMIKKSDAIVKATELSVNGEVVALAKSDYINSALEGRKAAFLIEGADCTVEFIENVELSEGYFLKSRLNNSSDIDSAVAALNVKTTGNIVTEIVTEYKSVTKKTAEKLAGYSAVTTVGKNGLNRVTQQVITVNGVEQQRTELSNEVVTAPINEVITVGTARNNASATAAQVASSAGFNFPLPAGTWQVSAYYGDGRGHKGIDLRAPKGTAIYAVAEGTVTKARYDGGFGYMVEIDHGNGITTLYAHASQLCVSVGARVNAGDVIALVGSTGNSTGNHLHFEVKVGGNRINPAPYIGL